VLWFALACAVASCAFHLPFAAGSGFHSLLLYILACPLHEKRRRKRKKTSIGLLWIRLGRLIFSCACGRAPTKRSGTGSPPSCSEFVPSTLSIAVRTAFDTAFLRNIWGLSGATSAKGRSSCSPRFCLVILLLPLSFWGVCSYSISRQIADSVGIDARRA